MRRIEIKPHHDRITVIVKKTYLSWLAQQPIERKLFSGRFSRKSFKKAQQAIEGGQRDPIRQKNLWRWRANHLKGLL